MKTNQDLRDRLQELHALTAQTPLFNPVFQLSLDISRELEGGVIDLSVIDALVNDLSCEALQSRAMRIRRLLAQVGLDDNTDRLRALADASAKMLGFEGYCARWSQPLLHVVFTGHPTFLLTPAQSDAVAEAASSGDTAPATLCLIETERPPITLVGEHDEAIAAMRRAGSARDAMVGVLLDVAAQYWPDRWQSFKPLPWRLATWVGYDMDGRTDIGWATSIGFRLLEKAERLAGYAEALADLDEGIAQRLKAAEAHSREMAALFATDLSQPAALSAAANRLTAEAPGKLLSLAPIISELEALAASQDEKTAKALLTVAAAMRADGLGMGGIHFRVNSAQLHNAIRRRIDPDNTLDLASGTALKRMRTLLGDVRPLRSNFAALAIENTTALRQFLAMAQILHHVDSDTPIRMLIAECEEPQTVLAALYFARLFGIADKVDVSPLFETESAMEHGARFLDALLGEPAYRDYARMRGRVSVQTGFSDAGRFVGQLPAALAIERLQGRMARIMAKHGLGDVAALIFNTHGESMGRGAHPASVHDRLRHPMSDWARAQFAHQGIRTELEASFQGGDGFLLFRTPQLALATLTRIAETEIAPPPAAEDPFYKRTDLSLDFYRGIRKVQRDHLASRTYARAITAFGLGLLNETGSRKSRRQSDISADREMSLRQIRAIPHNAILQQLGYPVNVLSGAGTAADDNLEAISELISASARGRQLFRLLGAANRLASIKSVAAYGELFNSAYWASRTYRGSEPHLEGACTALAERLTSDDRTGVFRRLASRLRVDGLKFHRLLARLPKSEGPDDMEETRRTLGVLQALRLALMQHMFLRAVQIPAFSRSNDISRDDVLEMVFTLRIDDAVGLLRKAFPVEAPALADFSVNEPSDYPDGDDQAYAGIQSAYIDPIANAYSLCLRISTAIANHFGAHG
ncbi:phosphoenolpyruvate carboxylase [Aquisediminimonas profunda]|uniref:phosphoenolpyruvate carboxylase n=1 Tax=Aquisediminimonas profunda TaxID=1550733 RepID=UPI001C62E383|nr:phosphoenolpyruvate carboxylase [Aquisediminimonas profunda]